MAVIDLTQCRLTELIDAIFLFAEVDDLNFDFLASYQLH
jgi:hypothetical protein